jgi:hypothetical protein
MSLSLRDDDAELLADLARLTGLGVLSAVPARATSKPQFLWKITSQPECQRLSELIELYPLRGRKRAEAAVWSRAVRALREGPRTPELPLAHRELRSLRRYVDPERRDATIVELPESELAPYLGGLFTGEGHLSISTGRCRVTLKLRDDDRPLLEAIAVATGLGGIYATGAYRTSRPAAAWNVHRRDEMPHAVELLERCGLRGRKLREFDVWREAALEVAKPRVRRSQLTIDDAEARMSAIRTYRAPTALPAQTDHRERRSNAYLEILRTAAKMTNGQLTSTAYHRARLAHPDWPTRNTIAAAFGSWAAALGSAGLAHRCSSRARADAAGRPRDYTGEELLKRHAARARVLGAVTTLAEEGALTPTVHDYLAHRAANDRSLPSLGRLYDLFPAGWWSVLKEAGLPARRRCGPRREDLQRPPAPADVLLLVHATAHQRQVRADPGG